jgi:hypothetical protein
MKSLSFSIKDNIIKDLNDQDLKKFLFMIKKLIVILPQQLKSNGHTLFTLFKFIQSQTFIENSMDEIGKLLFCLFQKWEIQLTNVIADLIFSYFDKMDKKVHSFVKKWETSSLSDSINQKNLLILNRFANCFFPTLNCFM